MLQLGRYAHDLLRAIWPLAELVWHAAPRAKTPTSMFAHVPNARQERANDTPHRGPGGGW
jgi:hypothetical protein